MSCWLRRAVRLLPLTGPTTRQLGSAAARFASGVSPQSVVELNQELDEVFGTSDSPVAQAHAAATSSSDAAAPGPSLSHVDGAGRATMVDVGQLYLLGRVAQADRMERSSKPGIRAKPTARKASTPRVAQASGSVRLGAAAFGQVQRNQLKKGDVLTVAQLAGIMAAKQTSALIPLCHNINLSKVDVQLKLEPSSHSLLVRAMAKTEGKTGVEMEALTAVAVAALTVQDMCKAVAQDMTIASIQLDYKSGGKSGEYLRSGLTAADLLPSVRNQR